jgi:hypothetical protein
MKIRYSKKQIRLDFIVGSLYFLTGILGIIFGSRVPVPYLFTTLGLFYLGSFYYKLKFQYLKLEGQVLTCFALGSKKKIDLSQVTRIKKFTDEITFLTPHEKLKISTKLIAREDWTAFQDLLASLDLEPDRNPFKKEIVKTI